MQTDIVGHLRDELIDMSFRQEEILSELRELVNSTDKNENVLKSLEICARTLATLEDNYKQLINEFEKAAYVKAVEYFKI